MSFTVTLCGKEFFLNLFQLIIKELNMKIIHKWHCIWLKLHYIITFLELVNESVSKMVYIATIVQLATYSENYFCSKPIRKSETLSKNTINNVACSFFLRHVHWCNMIILWFLKFIATGRFATKITGRFSSFFRSVTFGKLLLLKN